MKINFSKPTTHSPEKIKTTLADFENYDKWWPKKFKAAYTNHKGYDELYFSPAPGLTIIWEFEWINNILSTYYKSGPITGNGQWIVDNNTIHYNINVKPVNLFFKLILIPSIFSKRHKKDMGLIIDGLNNYLSAK